MTFPLRPDEWRLCDKQDCTRADRASLLETRTFVYSWLQDLTTDFSKISLLQELVRHKISTVPFHLSHDALLRKIEQLFISGRLHVQIKRDSGGNWRRRATAAIMAVRSSQRLRSKTVMTDQYVARIEEILWPEGPRQNIWMILDGARSIEVFRMLLACHLEYACLYSGALTPDLEMAAAYLVQLDHDYKDTHKVIERAWGNSWGVFLRSETSLKKLRRHLREFLVVRDEQGNRLVLRYYDTRVLRVYLPTRTTSELRSVSGPRGRARKT